MDLNPLDYEILEFVYRFEKIHIDDVLNKFPPSKFSTKYRLDLLTQSTYTTTFGLMRLKEPGFLDWVCNIRIDSEGNRICDRTGFFVNYRQRGKGFTRLLFCKKK